MLEVGIAMGILAGLLFGIVGLAGLICLAMEFRT